MRDWDRNIHCGGIAELKIAVGCGIEQVYGPSVVAIPCGILVIFTLEKVNVAQVEVFIKRSRKYEDTFKSYLLQIRLTLKLLFTLHRK